MKLRLRAKLMLAFMSVVALIVVLSLYSYHYLTEMGRGAGVIAERSESLEDAAYLQLEAVGALMPVNDYLITGDLAERENFEKQVQGIKTKLEEMKKNGLDEKERATISSVEAKLAEMEAAGQSLLKVGVAGADLELAGTMKEFDDKGMQLKEDVEKLHETQRVTMSNTMADIGQMEKKAVRVLVSISLVSVILGLAIGFLISRSITAPVLAMVDIARKVADGDLSRKVALKNRDELGELGAAINKMVDGLKDMVNNVTQTAAQVASAADQVNASARQINIGGQSQASAAEETSSSMEEMAASIQTVAQNAQKLASNVDETSASINQMVASIEQVAKSSEVMASSVSETSATMEQMAVSIDQVARDSESLAGSVEETSATIEQMVASIDQVAKNSVKLSDAVSGTSTAVEEIAASIKQVARNVAEADEISQRAAQDAIAGGEAVESAIEGISRISESMNVTAEVIGGLGRRSEEIGKIVGVIEDIADQTNLLALNAAIEAARAGDAGRGFAVVADEVRKLAERSVVATKEIGEVIKQVQTETARAVKSTEQGAAESKEGKRLSDQAGAALKRILDSVGATNRLMSEINNSTEQQTLAAAQVMKVVENMNHVTEQVTTAVNEQSLGSNQIKTAVESMNRTTQQVANAVREQSVGGKQIRVAAEDMNRLTSQVSTATKEQAAGSALIINAVENMNSMTQQVANATSEQKRGGELVVKAVENISEIARENLITVEQLTRASQDMAFQAESLQQSVSMFKTREITMTCWEIMHCKDELRLKCPAYHNQERRCWLISNTWCKGVQQGDARGKLANCMHCEAFKVMQGIRNIRRPEDAAMIPERPAYVA